MSLNDFYNDEFTMENYEAPVWDEGVYKLQIIEALKKTTPNGKPLVQIKWEALEGEHSGETLQDEFWFTGDDKQIGMTKSRLTNVSKALCGKTPKVDLRNLVGKEAHVMVKKIELKDGSWKNFIGKISLKPFEDLQPRKDVLSSILGGESSAPLPSGNDLPF